MRKQERADAIRAELTALYPEAVCSLDYDPDKIYELLFSTRLAAQCTDARVNIVAQTLYQKYPTLESFAQADLQELEEVIRPCGFFHTKARDLIACANRLLDVYGGVVPDNMEDLLTLPGVGRKTANIILGDVYHKPAVVTDTHCIRLANRMDLCRTRDPYKVELALGKLLPPAEQSDFCHRLVLHGRAVCTARSPKCAGCTLAPFCPRREV